MHLSRRVLLKFNTICYHLRSASGISNRNAKRLLIPPTATSKISQRFKHHSELLSYEPWSLDFLTPVLKDAKVDWQFIKDECKKSSNNITDANVEAIIVQHLMNQLMSDECRKFIEHLRLRPIDNINIGLIGKLLKFYGTLGFNNNLVDADLTYLYEIHNHIQKRFTLLDFNTLESYINAITTTPKWKDYADILEKYRSSLHPNIISYNAIIIAAFSNDEHELGWSLMDEILKDHKLPSAYVSLSWIKACVKKYKGRKLLHNLERLLYFSRANNIMLDEVVVQTIYDTLHCNLLWKSTVVTIDERSKCYNCKNKLEQNSLTDSEFKELSSEFFTKSLVGKNPFLKTSPLELNAFLNFLNRNSPFDIVVDALNVAYTKKGGTFGANVENVLHLVKTLLPHYKKILILGKKHMNKWSRECMNYFNDNTYVFLTENLSSDDPFLLYSAMSSPHTKFVSRDLMKSHSFLLETPELQLLFNRWQISHQCIVTNINRYGKVEIKWPIHHTLLPQKHGNIWHIPYRKAKTSREHGPFNYFNDVEWLCLEPPLKA